ncbi:hypothetical protein ABLN87_20815 [Ruegeria sp. SCPT10]|uniref:hypothetical protein n=1 Tax=Ruegeria sp. SCP10 TaxID=3141377 RepID=UPI00333D3A7B
MTRFFFYLCWAMGVSFFLLAGIAALAGLVGVVQMLRAEDALAAGFAVLANIFGAGFLICCGLFSLRHAQECRQELEGDFS